MNKFGEAFQCSIYKFCRRMLEEKDFPSEFSVTILYQLWNRKGSKENLNTHIYIYMKNGLARLTDFLKVSMMKDAIIEK